MVFCLPLTILVAFPATKAHAFKIIGSRLPPAGVDD